MQESSIIPQDDQVASFLIIFNCFFKHKLTFIDIPDRIG